MTTAYWFDLDGTLVTLEGGFDRLLEACLGAKQPNAVHETFREALFVAFETFDDAPFEVGFSAVADAHDLAIDPTAAAASFRERELAATTPVTGATVILEAAGELGPVGILTNGDGDLQRAKLERHGLDRHVDAVIVSDEVGVRKPDVGIFEHARSALSAEHHVYVGDSYEEDVAGARNAGFEAVHVRNDDGPPVSLDSLASLGLFLPAPGDTH